MQETIRQLRKSGKKPKLLLHVCCAPCSSYCIEALSEDFELILDFYNPNIATREEFEKREIELKRLRDSFDKAHQAQIITPEYDHQTFLEDVKGYENEPERGKRCIICYRERLKQAAKMALEQGADYFTTTLTISPQKNSQILNRIGEAIGKKYGIPYLYSDFKKRGGYLRSIELSKEFDLYRQDYCGCEFSQPKEE